MIRQLQFVRDFLERCSQWRNGINALTSKSVDRIEKTVNEGILVKMAPSITDKPNLSDFINTLVPIWHFGKPVSFEIWSCGGQVTFYFWATDKEHMEQIINQVNALYPSATFEIASRNSLSLTDGEYVCASIVKLEGEKFAKTRSVETFDYDPLSHILESLVGNKAMLQVIFKPVKGLSIPTETIEKIDEEYVKEISDKLGQSCFHAFIRIVAFSEQPYKAHETVKLISNAFTIFSGRFAHFKPNVITFPIFRSAVSLLKEIVGRRYPRFWELWKLKHRMLLSISEISSFVHLPVELSIVRYAVQPELPVPALEAVDRDGPIIGEMKFRGKRLDTVRLSLSDILKHQYIIGGTGTGKSTLLVNEVAQAARMGMCSWVIDPHGDLAFDIVESVGIEDVIFLDPIKVRFSINPFELPPYSDQYERQMMIERMIGQMVEMMKRLFGRKYWGPSLNRTFQNVVRILYQRDDSPTFEDVLNVLHGRFEELEGFADTRSFRDFKYELKKIPRERMDAVINKVDPFVKNSLLKMIFCSKESTIDLNELVKPGKLVIWRLAKSELTEMNMGIIGSAVITKLWFYCAARKRSERNPLMLVIDEFQNFSHLETLDIILAEARKYGIGLALSHQQTKQLPEKLLAGVLGNAATKIVFRVSGGDASLLARSLDITFERRLTSILANLPDGSAVVKLRAGFGRESIPPFEMFTLPPLEKKPVDFNDLILAMQRKFAVPTPPIQPPKPAIVTGPKTHDLLRAVYQLEQNKVEPTQGNLFSRLSESKTIGRASELPPLVDKAQSLGLADRVVVKVKRGRPKILVRLTKRGLETLAIGVSAGSSQKAGGELHRAMMMKLLERLREDRYYVVVPEQAGREQQPDLVAYPKEDNRWGDPIAIEIETRGQHPVQVRRNYDKNVEKGYRVVFVVPDKTVARRVKNTLSVKDAEIYTIGELIQE
jgi:hypothetical protein